MTHAYDKEIMLSARDNLAVMIDYAVTWSGMDLRDAWDERDRTSRKGGGKHRRHA